MIDTVIGLQRPRVQTACTISELYRNGHAVAGRFDDLMKVVASKTGARFLATSLKGALSYLSVRPSVHPFCLPSCMTFLPS